MAEIEFSQLGAGIDVLNGADVVAAEVQLPQAGQSQGVVHLNQAVLLAYKLSEVGPWT